jgi:hypothetical protein
MRVPTSKLRAQVARLRRRAANHKPTNPYAIYRDDPVGYAENVIHQHWWPVQKQIAQALVTPPYRVLVKASHLVGKTHLAGGLVNWAFDCFNPGVTLTSAPTARQVTDMLWKEVRKQRKHRLDDFVGPKIARLQTAPDHFAHGFTARDATAFQGQHEDCIFIFFDEAVGIAPEFWDAAETMVQGVRFAWLAIFNPTDTTSRAYLECQEDKWKVIEIAATEHPNIALELAGQKPQYPAAVRLNWFQDHLEKWSERIFPEDKQPGDLEFPPNSNIWYRPGPLADSRLLARWPTSGSGVWSERLWNLADTNLVEPTPNDIPEIGVDVARFGHHLTCFHVRTGPQSIYHESRNGWSTDQTAARIKSLCREWAQWATERRQKNTKPIDPKSIKVKIDDSGVGGGVVDQSAGYSFHGVGAGTRAYDQDHYPSRRSELWFALAENARLGRWSLSGKFSQLTKEQKRELKRQAMAPMWRVNWAGRKEVEQKEETEKKLGRSPDDMDAVNLSFCYVPDSEVASWVG